MAQIWIGTEDLDGTTKAWRFDQGTCIGPADLCEPANIVVRDTGTTDPVPAPALGQRALHQTAPHDHLPAAARLRIAGYLAAHKNWDGVVCVILPRTTHWCQISAGEVVSFASTLTPHLAALLGAGPTAETAAISDAMSRPERLATLLRRADLTGEKTAQLGALIGADLAANKPYWLGQPVALIGDPLMGDAYAAALIAQGVPVEKMPPDTAAQQGLSALWQQAQ